MATGTVDGPDVEKIGGGNGEIGGAGGGGATGGGGGAGAGAGGCTTAAPHFAQNAASGTS
jgi:hypothetical protein